MAELRKQALLASGVQVEALQQTGSAGAGKKVVYGNRKKKPTGKESSPAPESRPETPTPAPVSAPTEKPVDDTPAEVKSDWEASSDEEQQQPAPAQPAVKDSWDESSEDESGEPCPPILYVSLTFAISTSCTR